MSYLEELLPEFRKGAKIRRKGVPQPANAKGYIFYKEGKIYNEFGRECDPDLGFWLSKNDWELYKDPEPDWQYIIDNKCLCWFWNDCEKYAKEYGFLGFLTYVQPSNNTDRFEELSGKIWKYCRPVHKDEVNFYEDKKDDIANK